MLRDDGSAVAFLEAAEQLRDDMQQVVAALAQAKVGKTTQDIEEDVVAALKEMIEALKKAQKDQQSNSKKRPPSQQSGQPEEPPLVDVLAELKMIRALQMRVNTRTARYSKLIEGRRAGRQRRPRGRAQAAGRAGAADPSRHPRPANGEEPMSVPCISRGRLGRPGSTGRDAWPLLAAASPAWSAIREALGRSATWKPPSRPGDQDRRRWSGWTPKRLMLPRGRRPKRFGPTCRRRPSEDDVLARLVGTFALIDANAAKLVARALSRGASW